MPDVMVPSSPASVKLGGYIGKRIQLNEQGRLRNVDLEPLLKGFHHQPGSHPWIGEHIGKWIHAATLAWANSRDSKLKAKLDAAVAELISCQQSDGYLGTYTPDKRFGLFEGADWDVWTHKYDLLGLLTYYRFTGNPSALQCSARVGDLLINTFGDGKRSIRSAGTHMGMASTSVLEPMVLLYRSTGQTKYLDFAKTIVKSWNEKDGPRIISTLSENRPIDQVGNGKAYEMLSNLVGLCELARATGGTEYLDTAKRAWSDVVKHELYITGSASYYEHFHPGDDLPNQTSKNVGETCVTVTWMQLSEQLLRLTGEAKYASEFERSEYNHLAAAQMPDGTAWCYYTSLQGKKPYTNETCCCLSSGPRGMAIIPETAYMTTTIKGVPFIVVNTPETSSATLIVAGSPVTIQQMSDFPNSGTKKMKIISKSGKRFGIQIRHSNGTIKFAGGRPDLNEVGWQFIPAKVWKSESFDCSAPLSLRKVDGTGSNLGRVAWTYGPFVLAKDEKSTKIWPWLKVAVTSQMAKEVTGLVPFAEVGANGDRFKVWLPTASSTVSLFSGTMESRSQIGNSDGSIVDDDPESYTVTFNGARQSVAWFAATVANPVSIGRVTFTQGPVFHDGGWFDSSKGKPIVQIQMVKDGPWKVLGSLEGYPETTGENRRGLKGGEVFEYQMPNAQKVYGIRIQGVPSTGDNPRQAFASCGELQAFR